MPRGCGIGPLVELLRGGVALLLGEVGALRAAPPRFHERFTGVSRADGASLAGFIRFSRPQPAHIGLVGAPRPDGRQAGPIGGTLNPSIRTLTR